jgi:hypothetical protein
MDLAAAGRQLLCLWNLFGRLWQPAATAVLFMNKKGPEWTDATWSELVLGGS